MGKFILLVLVCGVGAYLIGAARAQESPRPQIAELRADYNQAQRNRCRAPITHYRWPNVWRIPDASVGSVRATWRNRLARARERQSLCSNPAAVIRQVFGPTAWAALRVAECESHLYPRAVGAAGERGLFQIHPVHFSWLDEGRLFQPRYNSRIAYRMSRGGTNWGPWTCKP